MKSRRQFLGSLGLGAVTGLAGCLSLDGGSDDSDSGIEAEDLQGWEPDTLPTQTVLPFDLAPELQETHQARANALVESVPTDPSIPNGHIAQQIITDREHVRTQLETEPDGPPLQALHSRQRTRTSAAELYGAYRAATGNDDGGAVSRRRRESREAWSSVSTAIEYEASTPVEAVLVYAPIERRLEQARHESEPQEAYPDRPLSNVEQAGNAFEAVETAIATVESARGIRNQYLETRPNASPQWNRLLRSLRDLEISVSRTQSERVDLPENPSMDEFEGIELSGIQRELLHSADRELRYGDDPIRDRRVNGQPATAILQAGRTLAAIAAYEAVAEGIRDGAIPDASTETSVKTAAERAVSAIESLLEDDHSRLRFAVARPARSAYESGVRRLDDGYYDVEEIEAQFRYATVSAYAVAEAVPFVVSTLEE
ncbi:hypothetical protein RH831_08225 [Halodesulfurarchaeum sp. HSR-GB]|uniref:hypothetical protein n=1 Tax=Halodesulfurarchaeum sp. HSR-GB TaxID=3074077 RepID=UPI00285EC314|nr:hypothetical protein [Halodesulfurarchaeum sp. HSR-GB]MDR5657165.1 hypothetical protein [Halodesulfurarchaeum sp. HSR-GB]